MRVNIAHPKDISEIKYESNIFPAQGRCMSAYDFYNYYLELEEIQ